MNRTIRAALAGLILAAYGVAAATIEPYLVDGTAFVQGTAASITGTFPAGDTVRFTNCVAYSGSTTNSAVQNLTNITTVVKVSTTIANSSTTVITTNAATTIVATNGTFWFDAPLPSTSAGARVQVVQTDTNSATRHYPPATMTVATAL